LQLEYGHKDCWYYEEALLKVYSSGNNKSLLIDVIKLKYPERMMSLDSTDLYLVTDDGFDEGIVSEIKTRQFVKSGVLLKRSRFLKDWRKRWFVLTGSHLSSYKSQKEAQSGGSSSSTEDIALSDCMSV
jgi:hypothetical protein